MPKVKKPKLKSVSKLKKEAWEWFSKYVRLRDCLITQGSKEYGKCFTCDRVYGFKELQAGHFVDGRVASILFNEDIVHAQCYGCNVCKKGNKDQYTPRMIKLYGLKKVEGFWDLKKENKEWDREELEKIRDYYKEEYQSTCRGN